MPTPLSDELLGELLEGQPPSENAAHDLLVQPLEALRVELDELAGEAEPRARERVLGRLREQKARRPVRRTALLAAAALVSLLVGSIPPGVWVAPPETGPDAYDALLLEVELSLQQEVPSALEPAAWLAAEFGPVPDPDNPI